MQHSKSFPQPPVPPALPGCNVPRNTSGSDPSPVCPAPCAEYCAFGSLTDVIYRARTSEAGAAQLGWPRRLHLVRRRLPARHCRASWLPVLLLRCRPMEPLQLVTPLDIPLFPFRPWRLRLACCTCTRGTRP